MSKNDIRSLLSITRKIINENHILLEDTVGQLSPEEYNLEIDKFNKAVSSSTKFEQDPSSFKLYDGYVEWSGNLLREQISFTFTTESTDGLYLSGMNQVQLTEDTFTTIKNLMVYYKVWSEYWGAELSQSNNQPQPPQSNYGQEFNRKS